MQSRKGVAQGRLLTSTLKLTWQQSIIWEITPVGVKLEQKKLRLLLKADKKCVKEQAEPKILQLKILQRKSGLMT